MQLSAVRSVQTDKKLNIDKVNQPSELTRDKRLDVLFIDVEALKPYALQARKVFNEEEIIDLAGTIASHGIRNPLTVIRSTENPEYFEILSGERRWRAAKLIGLKQVPCIVNENIQNSQEIALIENIQRKDLTPIELLEGVESYINNNPNMQKEEAIRRLGMSKAHFYRILSLVGLTKDARKIAAEKQVSIEALVQISKAAPERQLEILEKGSTSAADKEKGAHDQSLNDVFTRAMSKKSKILEIKIKRDQIETDTNFYILSNSNKENVILLLKRFIAELEGVDGIRED